MDVGKEKAQVVQGKPLSEGVLAQDILDERGFAALELADFFLRLSLPRPHKDQQVNGESS